MSFMYLVESTIYSNSAVKVFDNFSKIGGHFTIGLLENIFR